MYVLALRNPFLAAKAVATAAALSEGRVALGIGVGWCREEFALAGQDFGTRGKRTDEMIEVLRKLWSGAYVEHDGPFYRFDLFYGGGWDSLPDKIDGLRRFADDVIAKLR